LSDLHNSASCKVVAKRKRKNIYISDICSQECELSNVSS
jgi:hypothetical protein